MKKREDLPQILLTNDDGIQSPGLWAAAEALSSLGWVTVAAPRDQVSATGRSLPVASDGRIQPTQLKIGSDQWQVYAVGGTPAQVVLHTILEIMPTRPNLVVSGINYGENVGNGITVSGTVGAAMEAASLGIPAMAVSLELVDVTQFLVHSKEVEFKTAAYFTAYFAKMLLEKQMPADVDLLKVDVPFDATPETAWQITRLAHHRYFSPVLQRKGSWNDHGYVGAKLDVREEDVPPGTDVHTLRFARMVSATPLSLDQTSRVKLCDLEQYLRS